LEMTDCEKNNKGVAAKKLLQVRRCTDECSKKSFIDFEDDRLKQKVKQLQSVASHDLMQDTFKDLFEGIQALEDTEFVQTDARVTPVINKTQFNNPPLPRTEVPMNPCTDPKAGGPVGNGGHPCKIVGTHCYKLQERFLLIQSGIEDERDELKEQIAMLERFRDETTETLQHQIKADIELLSSAQTKLAAATEKEATAGEEARGTAAENDQLNKDLVDQMKTCTQNYLKLENEVCALGKIRGELYKMKGGGHSAFFQDCEVSKWDPEECSKVCQRGKEGGGVQKLTRAVLTPRNGGAKCLPLAAVRSCNNHPCPVDCHLSSWSEWSKCSAQCGGGVETRLREVKVAMKYKGKPCGGVSQTRSCNSQACEKDCELGSWTRWTACSKDCDGGTRKRQRFVTKVAAGAGKCPGAWSMKRLEYTQCNMKRCKLAPGDSTLTCNKKQDVVLLIDGSGSLGSKGWKAEIKAAQLFVDAFHGSAQIAVILYSGPSTWGGVSKCLYGKDVDMEKTCKIKTVTHFTNDTAEVKRLISDLKWPRGSTLTSIALQTAKAALGLGRKDAKPSVIVFTDGRPLSYRRTEIASKNVRKSARLVWVPVTQYAPLAYIKKWATRRWQENVVVVRSFKELENPDVITHIVANICPQSNPEVMFTRR